MLDDNIELRERAVSNLYSKLEIKLIPFNVLLE